MLRSCEAPGCSVLTLGRFCAGHEPASERRSFPRGRPYAPPAAEPAVAGEEPDADVVFVEGAE